MTKLMIYRNKIVYLQNLQGVVLWGECSAIQDKTINLYI